MKLFVPFILESRFVIGWAIIQWLIVNWVARQEFFCWNRLIKILIAQYLKLRVAFLVKVLKVYLWRLPGTGFHYHIAVDYLAVHFEKFQNELFSLDGAKGQSESRILKPSLASIRFHLLHVSMY